MKLHLVSTLTSLLVVAVFAMPAPCSSADLSDEQIAAIRTQLDKLRETLEGSASERNRSAWSVFMSASQSDKEAAELYEKSIRLVNYEREGRDESEFRDWQRNQKDRYKDEQYMESMRLQLRWLAITCKAAESEDFSEVLPETLTYLDSLTQQLELPGAAAMSSVTGSIFARAYQLERVIGNNEKWETVPFNLVGIYEKTILPYLREENPAQLMVAWDKRIAQQTRFVEFIKAKQEAELRGGRDDKRRTMDQQRRQQESRGILRDHDEDNFVRDTLPALHWARLIDKYHYIDSVSAAQEMLVFLNENVANTKIMDWLDQLQAMLGDIGSPGFSDDSATPAPAPAPTTTRTAPPATTATGPTSPAATSGKVTEKSLGLD